MSKENKPSLSKIQVITGCSLVKATELAEYLDEFIKEDCVEHVCHRVIMSAAGNPPYYTGGVTVKGLDVGCSECGAPWGTRGTDFKYCPNCRAKVVDE